MPIVAVCGNCSKRYTLDDEFAGKSVKCRTCKESFEVPGGDDPTLMVDASPPGSDGSEGKRRRTTTGKKKKPPAKRPTKPSSAKDDDVLELRTEFAKRAAAQTIEEPRTDTADSAGRDFDKVTGRSGKGERGGAGTRKRYKKKKRWLLKSFVALIVLLGIAIGVGAIFVPKNMAKKWDQTKTFWGTGLLQWGKDMIAIDMDLESAPVVDEEAAKEPEGPPAGSIVVVRGAIVSVEKGPAGREPTTFKVKGSNGTVYRIVLEQPSPALADIKGELKSDGSGGPSVEVRGTLAKNPFDSKMTQVEKPEWAQKEAADIAGAEPFVVESEPGADEPDHGPGDEPGDGPGDGSGDESGAESGDESGAESGDESGDDE